MRNCRSLFVMILLTGLFACTDRSADQPAPGEAFISFADDGAWCWFSDPRGLFYEGKHKRTYAGWVDSTGSLVVGYYDHDLKTIDTRIIHPHLEKDDHNNPALLMGKDGRLMVFYSKHSTREPLYLQQSKDPESIAAWEEIRQLSLNDTALYHGMSDTYTYANVCRLQNEDDKLFLFWRGADYKPNFSLSTDQGKSWSQGRILILPERTYVNRRPYMKVASNNADVIHFAFTDGHPNVEPTNSIYYMRYQQGALYKADGQKIMDWSALPVSPGQADVVYDASSSREKAWIWDVAENENGDPVVVYARFPNDTTHVYYYSTWENGRWVSEELVNSGPWFPQTPAGKTEREPNYSGGIVVDQDDPSTVYLSLRKNGIFEIEKWTRTKGQQKWKITEITKNSASHNVRPFVVRNHLNESPGVLWLNISRYVHYTDYRTAVKMDVLPSEVRDQSSAGDRPHPH